MNSFGDAGRRKIEGAWRRKGGWKDEERRRSIKRENEDVKKRKGE